MQGKKIMYKKGYLDNYYHGGLVGNAVESVKNKNKIISDLTINSNFCSHYDKVNNSPVKIKLIK